MVASEFTPLIQGDALKLKKAEAAEDTALLHLMFKGEKESIQSVLETLDGTHGVLGHVINQKKATITYKPDARGARELMKIVQAQTSPDLEVQVDPRANVKTVGEMDPTLKQDLYRCLPALACVMILLMVLPQFPALMPYLSMNLLPGLHLQTAGLLLFSFPIMFIYGARFHKGAYKAFKSGVLDMNVLISVSTGLTFGYSMIVSVLSVLLSIFFDFEHAWNPPPSYFEAPAMIITFILVGKCLEGSAKQATADCLNELLGSQPLTANLLEGPSTTKAASVPVELLQIGDAIQVFPGEAVPVDGKMSSDGEARFDESLLTGESRPVKKFKGDAIIGGSRCLSGRVVMQVTRIGSGTMLSQISSLVENAQTSRAPVQTVADTIAKYFIPFVLVIATMTWFVWYTLVFALDVIPMEEIAPRGTTWPIVQKYFFVMEFGLTVLLVACPCALGLATPTAVMTATGVAAKHGILLKNGGLPLELGSKITHLVLDKTGTITEGKPTLHKCACLDTRNPTAAKAWDLLKEAYLQNIKKQSPVAPEPVSPRARLESLGEPLDQVYKAAFWWAVGCAEMSSEHPLGKILVDIARSESGAELTQPTKFSNVTGKGVHCTIGDLTLSVASMPSILQESPFEQASVSLEPWTKGCRVQACTVIGLAVNGVPLGGMALRDQVAPYAKQCISSIQECGVEIWMCTGDHAATAQAVAKECGIPPWKIVAGALPADKVNTIKKLQQEVNFKSREKKNVVAMVGDGVNDSPALAAADVGVAIGAGHNVTVDAADVVLVRSDFRNLMTYLQLCKEAIRTIWINFFWAFLFNICALPIAAGMLYNQGIKMTPVAATAIMATSSLFVVNCSLALRNFQPRLPQM